MRHDILSRADDLRTAKTRYAAGDIRLNELLPIPRDWAALQLTYLESLRDLAQAWADLRALNASAMRRRHCHSLTLLPVRIRPSSPDH